MNQLKTTFHHETTDRANGRTHHHRKRKTRRLYIHRHIADLTPMKKQRPRSVHPLIEKQRMHRNTLSAKDEAAQLPRVLLVEDHDLLRRLISDMLKTLANVETSISAKEAIEKARAQAFDALVLDISLGSGGNGIDVMNVLRQDPRYRTTPMIACTAIVGAGYEKRLLKAGFDAYLAKPFEPNELQQLVVELIADRS